MPSASRKAGRSSGEGKRRAMASSSSRPPLFSSEEPTTTGTRLALSTPLRRPEARSSSEREPSSRYFSISSSSDSAMFSTVVSCRSAASSAMASGMRASVTAPFSPNIRALPPRMSTTPVNTPSVMTGMYRVTGFMPSTEERPLKAISKSARSRSILLMNTKDGSPASRTAFQMRRVRGRTPSTASMTRTAASTPISREGRSPVKLVSPGTSMRKWRSLFQRKVANPGWMEPRRLISSGS